LTSRELCSHHRRRPHPTKLFCRVGGVKWVGVIIHHRFWNVSISIRKIDRKSPPSVTVSSLNKFCDMPRHLRLGLPVNSSQMSTEQSSQSSLLERCNPWPHVANRHISISQLLSLWRHLIMTSFASPAPFSRLRRSQPPFSL